MPSSFMEKLSRLRPRYALVLELDGRPVMTEKVSALLKLIDEHGSILSASKILGISYSRAWEWISKAERLLQVQLIERKLGGKRGGGARLTKECRLLLETYDRFSVSQKDRTISLRRAKRRKPVFAGSHDPLLSLALGFVKEKEVYWIGSMAGLMALSIGDADVAGIHLYDQESDSYNLPIIRRLGLSEVLEVYEGFEREIGVAFHPSVELKKVEDVFSGKVTMINRNPGSGSRVLFEVLLEREAKKLGTDPDVIRRRIPGYNTVAWNHQQVVDAIASGRAQAGVTLRYVADMYKLRFMPIRWESYDIAVRKGSEVEEFLNVLKEKGFKELLETNQGYRPKPGMGKRLKLR